MSDSRYKKIKDLKFDSYLIDCPVEIEKGALLLDNILNNVLLQMRLYNVGISVVSSVYVSVDCFDDAGDAIPEVNSVEHAYLDLETADKTSFGEKTPISLDRRVRNVKVTITKVTMKVGEAWRNTNAQEFMSPKQESINHLGTALVNQFNRETNLVKTLQRDRIEYLPKQIEGIWLCSCGRANQNESEICCRCGMQKAWIFEHTDKKYLSAKLSEYNEHISVDSAQQKILDKEADMNKIRKGKKYQIIAMLTVLFLVIATSIWKIFLEPNYNYNKGIALFESQDYASAAKAFEKLEDYKNSVSWLENTNYNLGLELLRIKDYSSAIEVFKTLGEHKNSVFLLQKAKFGPKYEEAVKLYERKYFYEAREIFSTLGEFYNSENDMFLSSFYYKIEGSWYEKGTGETITFMLTPLGTMQAKYSSGNTYSATWDENLEFTFHTQDNEGFQDYQIAFIDNSIGGKLDLNWLNRGKYDARWLYFVSK